jgi:TPR repeat protein
MYARGEGVPQDYVKARQWYKQAAANGDAEAQILLGVMYLGGYGVPQDYMRAYMWYSLAAASTGDQQTHAAEGQDRVARRMNPAQIAEAQRFTQQCQAQQFKGC